MTTYRAYPDWTRCTCGREPFQGFVRLFKSDDNGNFAALTEEDGMPGQAWVWGCNFEIIELTKTVFMKAAQSGPPIAGTYALRALGKSLGCEWITLQRLDEATGKLVTKTYPIR